MLGENVQSTSTAIDNGDIESTGKKESINISYQELTDIVGKETINRFVNNGGL